MVRLGVLVLTLLLSGCLGDPPPDPEVQPLEVVVGSRTASDPCLLNVSEIRAGTHEVMVISEAGPSTVRILSATDEVVYAAEVAPMTEEPVEAATEAVLGEEPGSVRLGEGDFRVECIAPDGSVSETPLRVDPARPGYGGGSGAAGE